MAKKKSPQVPAPELDPSTTTRSEALREALKAGTSPVPTREFSTLVERSEPAQTPPECADERNCIAHGRGMARGDFVWPHLDPGLRRLLEAVDRLNEEPAPTDGDPV